VVESDRIGLDALMPAAPFGSRARESPGRVLEGTRVQIGPICRPEPTVYEPGAFLRFACADDPVYAYMSVLTSAWRLDLDAGAWQELPPPPQPTAIVGSAAWTGTELLVSIVIRSREPVTTTRDAFVFDPTSRTWRTTPNAEVHEDDATQVWSEGFAYQLGYEPSGKVTVHTYRPE
jgi:hypothetical protein